MDQGYQVFDHQRFGYNFIGSQHFGVPQYVVAPAGFAAA
jgi:hypothetical protein